jgi:hypothetical protein
MTSKRAKWKDPKRGREVLSSYAWNNVCLSEGEPWSWWPKSSDDVNDGGGGLVHREKKKTHDKKNVLLSAKATPEEERRGVAFGGHTWLWVPTAREDGVQWSVEPAKVSGKKRGTWFWRIRSIEDLDINSDDRLLCWRNQLMNIIHLPKELLNMVLEYNGLLVDIDHETSQLLTQSVLQILPADRTIVIASEPGEVRDVRKLRGVLKLQYPDCVGNLLYFRRRGPKPVPHLPETAARERWVWSTWHKHCDLTVCTEPVIDWTVAVFRVQHTQPFELYGSIVDQPPFFPPETPTKRWYPRTPSPPAPKLTISRSLNTIVKLLPEWERTHCHALLQSNKLLTSN